MRNIRRSRDDERSAILAIVNAAAEAYRGAIPADRWHEPYMPAAELDREISAGIVLWVYETDGALAGTMGIQPVRDVDLIRHAYVLPGNQRQGVGSSLIGHLRSLSKRRMLVGTWAAAEWRSASIAATDSSSSQDLLDRARPPDRDLGGAGESAVLERVRPTGPEWRHPSRMRPFVPEWRNRAGILSGTASRRRVRLRGLARSFRSASGS